MSAPIITEVLVDATPERVWRALTDTEEMKQWYFSMNGFGPVEGNTFTFYEPGENRQFLHRCTILEIVPGKRLKHTWSYPEKVSGVSVVTWEIEPAGDRTKVSNTHEGLENFAEGGKDFAPENFVAGWDEILNKLLKTHVETE